MSRSRVLLASSLLALLAPSLRAQAQILVVDDQAGPGVDFTSLQSAVDASSANDLILVKAGTYPGLTIDGRSVQIAADTGALATLSAKLNVKNLSASQSVVISGLKVAPTLDKACVLSANMGPVVLEACNLIGKGIDNGVEGVALEVSNSSDVVVVRSALTGSTAGGNHALRALGSSIHLWECTLTGGTVGQQVIGKDGANLDGGFLYAMGTTFQGGAGGQGILNPTFGICTDGAPGGSGLVLSVGAVAQAVACTYASGPGGPPGSASCVQGASGTPTKVLSGSTLSIHAIGAKRYEAPNPLRHGQNANLTFQGNAGDLVWLMDSTGIDPVFDAALHGTVCLLQPVTNLTFLGVVPAGGVKQVPVAISLPAGVEVKTLRHQAVFFSVAEDLVVSNPYEFFLLAAGF